MKRSRKGFTILELLVVISIIAIVATLATGAAMKSIRQGRKRRVETMRAALQMALVTYRTQQGEWPFKIGEDVKNNDKDSDDEDKEYIYTCHGKDNKKVFTKLYEKKGEKTAGYLDPSAFFVYYKGGRRLLKDVPEGDRKDLPIGYPDIKNQDKFRYFSIEYNRMTDSVSVKEP